MAAVTIRAIRTFLLNPQGHDWAVVKVETSEPGLNGLGCATFTQRIAAVKTVVDDYLAPLLAGREIDRIEELWRLMTVNGYWRHGPVLNNAIAGVDMALWDLKGKRAGMPVYQLLGGACREAAAVYRHAGGRTLEELERHARGFIDAGVRHVRVQAGHAPYGGQRPAEDPPAGARPGAYYDPRRYMDATVEALAHVRAALGDGVELLHDVHERLTPAQAVEFARRVEPFRLFFLEDLLAPEDVAWFANVRAASTVPLAMGELFVHPGEWTPLVAERRIDFLRMHLSFIGGLTPARKAAALAEAFGARTAWHGPPDLTPVGVAANLHLDLAVPNFGIQEYCPVTDDVMEIFPGTPELKGGYLYPNAKPGFGVDFDETLAGKFPAKKPVVDWTQARLPDGSLHRP